MCVSTKIYTYRPIFKVAKFVICNICTPSKTNVAPENGSLIKEDSYSKPSFLGSMMVYVSFRGLSDPEKKKSTRKKSLARCLAYYLWQHQEIWKVFQHLVNRNTSGRHYHDSNVLGVFYCRVSAGVAWPGCIRSNARIFAASIDSNNIGQPQLAIKSEVRFSGVIFSG